MKKLPILILLSVFLFNSAHAKRYADLYATLSSPLNNDTVVVDESFNIVLQVINNGVDTFRGTDTAQFVLEFDGSPILFSIGGGPSKPYLPYTGAEIVPGDTVLVGFSFTLFSGWDTGAVNFCARFIPYNAADTIVDTILTNNGGCANIIVYHEPTNITSTANTDNEIKVFPNPAIDKAYVKINMQKTSMVSVALYDMLGKQVLQQSQSCPIGETNLQIDVANLPKGVYNYEVRYENETLRGRLMVR